MSRNETGVLPSQMLKRVLKSGYIQGVKEREYVNPASIDLPLSSEAYRLESTLLPRRNERVRPLIEKAGGLQYDLKNHLEVGVAYLIRVEGTYKLPPNIYGYVNPKSSTGRLNLFCRVVADKVDMYDALRPEGWKGEMWVLVRPDSFPVLLTPGQAVSQLRLFDGKTFLDELELNFAIERHGLFFHPRGERFSDDEIPRHASSLLLSLDLGPGMVGWECRGTNKVLDYAKKNHHRVEDYFSPIRTENERIILHKNSFYILSTYEHVVVPPELSAELRAIDPRFGEFRSHAAGYIDPGWGWGKDGSQRGRPITLEVTPHENMMICHRQTVVKIRYEQMKEPPIVPYDAGNSNYSSQNSGPALSKHFRKNEEK